MWEAETKQDETCSDELSLSRVLVANRSLEMRLFQSIVAYCASIESNLGKGFENT